MSDPRQVVRICDRLKTEQRNLEHLFKTALARIAKADAAIAAKDAALKPLADLDLFEAHNPWLLKREHVKAARAALSLNAAPASPEPRATEPPGPRTR